MDRIDEKQLISDPQATLERALAGETIEILRDGRTIARLVPSQPARRILPGGSATFLNLADPADTLDDLLSDDDVKAWYGSETDRVE